MIVDDVLTVKTTQTKMSSDERVGNHIQKEQKTESCSVKGK